MSFSNPNPAMPFCKAKRHPGGCLRHPPGQGKNICSQFPQSFPNVGKSSFVNSVTRANVEVQPYAFTTKSLYVGHTDYQYLRWQVIDTPGILDKPLEDRNTIEMQAITALAHLRACVICVLDITEQCGYSLKQQCELFNNIKPLFANKPIIIALNKIDTKRPEDLSVEEKAMLEETFKKDGNHLIIPMSTFTKEGVSEVQNTACDALLAHRIEQKMSGNKVDNIVNRLHVAQPKDGTRAPHIPEAVLAKRAGIKPAEVRKLERDMELELGDDYILDLKKHYDLPNPDHKYDDIPEIWEGHNIADFVDPDIMKKLEDLEKEEAMLEEAGVYASEEEDLTEEQKEIRGKAGLIRKEKAVIRHKHRLNKHRNRTPVSDRVIMKKQGIKRARSLSRVDPETAMEVDAKMKTKKTKPGRDISGLRDAKQVKEVKRLKKRSQIKMNQFGRAGEADRHISAKLPKHLFSGKRDAATKKTLGAIPILKTKAGPRDKDEWPQRLKEEFGSLIKNNKEADNDWFRIESNKEGTRWFGKCWYIQDYKKYEFELEFDLTK
eukprot:sb/3463625/